MERNIYQRIIINKKKQLISKQVIDSKGNTKKLYKLTAHLAGINTDNQLPSHDNDESLAKHFADYFISKNSQEWDLSNLKLIWVPLGFDRHPERGMEQNRNIIVSWPRTAKTALRKKTQMKVVAILKKIWKVCIFKFSLQSG